MFKVGALAAVTYCVTVIKRTFQPPFNDFHKYLGFVLHEMD